MTKYVALYLRISEDKTGRVEGVKAQERWGRAYAAEHWPGLSVRVFADNDISASNGDHRPEYEALRQALAAGEVAHVWTVEQSRLERREVGWFTLAAELDAAGITELHTRRDGIVRVRDDVAGIKAVLAAGEARRTRERVLDKMAVLAAEGRPTGGAVYGYRSGVDATGGKTLVIIEEEAVIIREMATRVLDGWSLTSIADDLRGRGVVGPIQRQVRDDSGQPVVDKGRPVRRASRPTSSSVRSMLTGSTVAGLRIYKGHTVQGVWPAILDRDTWDAVRDRLTAARTVHGSNGRPREVNPVQRHTGRRYLLTGGTARCGICGMPLVCVERQLRSHRKPYYQCHPNRGGKGCIGIIGDPFEAYVVEQLLAELDKPEFLDALAADDHAARRDEITTALRGIEAQRNDLAAMWAAQELTAEEWRTARQGLAQSEQRLRAELAQVPPALSRVDPAAIRAGWDAMNLDERREIISLFVERVTVHRAKPGTAGFDAGRVEVVWR